MSTEHYCPCYCEENIWWMCLDPRFEGRECHVIFVSNRSRQVAFWCQQQAPSLGAPMVWDYHVVLLVRRDPANDARPPATMHPVDTDPELSAWEIWDPDSSLPRPSCAREYLDASFPVSDSIPESFRPGFRIIPASTFLLEFHSDRSHMKTQEGWRATPPVWQAILGPHAEFPARRAGTHNLDAFIDVSTNFLGECLDLKGLQAWISAAPSQSDA